MPEILIQTLKYLRKAVNSNIHCSIERIHHNEDK